MPFCFLWTPPLYGNAPFCQVFVLFHFFARLSNLGGGGGFFSPGCDGISFCTFSSPGSRFFPFLRTPCSTEDPPFFLAGDSSGLGFPFSYLPQSLSSHSARSLTPFSLQIPPFFPRKRGSSSPVSSLLGEATGPRGRVLPRADLRCGVSAPQPRSSGFPFSLAGLFLRRTKDSLAPWFFFPGGAADRAFRFFSHGSHSPPSAFFFFREPQPPNPLRA